MVGKNSVAVLPIRAQHLPARGRLSASSSRAATGDLLPQPPAAGHSPREDLSALIIEFDRHRRRNAGAGGTEPLVSRDAAQRVAAVLEFIRRRMTGDYVVDEFGFDPHFNGAVVMPLLTAVFKGWFRVEVSGAANVPESGAALVVANHAGVLPLDGMMLSAAVYEMHSRQRQLRLLAADLVFDNPWLCNVARKAGHTLACPEDAHRLLEQGALTAVFPEGYKGLGKSYRDRYKVQRFGRGGFVSAALRARAPIIPCAIIGSEEIYPKLADVPPLARLLGLPYFPITPLFPLAGAAGLIPLPSKWHIHFADPIRTTDYDASAAEDPMVAREVTEQVRETIQASLRCQLRSRRNAREADRPASSDQRRPWRRS